MLLTLLPIFHSNNLFAQRVVTTTGNWDNSGIWQGGNIADIVTESVSINDNIGTVTVRANYTVGDVVMNNGNTITINEGFTLNVGNSTNARSLTSGNTGVVNVNGRLIIWGDLNVGNNLDLNVGTGDTLIIYGNVNMGNGGDLVIAGNVQITGNFVGGNDTDLIVNGNVSIGGNLTVGNNSDPTGTGTVTVGGSCSDGGSNFCGVGPLPITLIFFTAEVDLTSVNLSWATASEKNFHYFSLQRSKNGKDFFEVARIEGHGTTQERKDYSRVDSAPLLGKSYYRLTSVDFDGYTETFNVIAVNYNGSKSARVFPNPAVNGKVKLTLSYSPEEEVNVLVTDLTGIVRKSFKTQSPDLDLDLQSGTYLVKISSKDFNKVIRVVIP